LLSKLKQAILDGNQEMIKGLVGEMEPEDNWSLISLIEELSPLMLMESNLTYGSFHLIKMSLFLRELAIKNYFSRETEKQLIKAVALNLSNRHFVKIQSERTGYKEEKADLDNAKKMMEEIDKGNAHNAYYYALGLLKEQPDDLSHLLIQIGSRYIGNSLGHSLSCFYPVVSDYINNDSSFAANSLLSYVMYLCRYDLSEKQQKDIWHSFSGKQTKNNFSFDYNQLTYRCASGEGIINLHHMITLAIFVLWESNDFADYPPYNILLDWIDDKEIDKKQKRIIEDIAYDIALADNYQEFKTEFDFSKLDSSIKKYFAFLKKDFDQAVDWLFRLYADNLGEEWNPHYITGLYAALVLYSSEKLDKKAAEMAIYQAIKYFADEYIDLD